LTDTAILMGDGPAGPALLPLKRANRHGLIAGATGTGKTVTVQRLAEGFALAGVPVVVADVKGDLCGIASGPVPAICWDLFGKQGHPIRVTVSDMGPTLLGRLLDLNDVQSGVLEVAFKLADDRGLLLLDLKDLRALLIHISENAKAVAAEYGLVSAASIAAIQRALLALENQGAAEFFGEPALDLADLMRVDAAGKGIVSILAADQLMQRPRVYASFLLWLMAELFEDLPEAGDLPKPKLVLVFDEAHLLFDGAAPALVDQIEQVVRLIRSKGVGIYFCTQNPLDLPESVLGQLGHRVQHALRAFTPRDQKAVRAAAETFRPNPQLDTLGTITTLGVGEALVSFLDEKGVPGIVERARIRLPESRLGPLSPLERRGLIAMSPVAGRYEQTIDRESAYEKLTARVAATAAPAPGPTPAPAPDAPMGAPRLPSSGIPRSGGRSPAAPRQRESVGEALAKSVARTVGSELARAVVRGVLGAILKQPRRR
jgi:DNA helicase HerA-like ATPase